MKKELIRETNRYIVLLVIWGFVNIGYSGFLISRYGFAYHNLTTAITCASVSFIVAYLLRRYIKEDSEKDD